ncbi:PIN domain-like protein [Mycena olivaceomarginata]|nr:PIN domain-like protein [Mycena olivaceomarginata]
MGIPDLWKVLASFANPSHLTMVVGTTSDCGESFPATSSLMTGFVGNSTEARGYRVGIDASGWIYRTLYRHGSTKSPELVALFSRCSRLFRLPFIPVFVFDGPGRPSLKRGKLVKGNDHWLVQPFQQMLDGFGFMWIVAPGEAEAELSTPLYLEQVLSYTSALRIMKTTKASRYSSFDISTVLGLSREDLVLIAILAGGDYSDGLENCGITTAIALARAGLAFRPPRLDILACFAEDHFTWGDSLGILVHFADNLFAGLVIRELAQRALASDGLPSEVPPPSIIKKVVGRRSHQSTGHLAELRLVLSVDPSLLTHALNAITCRHDPALGAQIAVAAWLATKLPQVRTWVPQSMVDRVYPGLVLDYICAQVLSATRKGTRKGKTPARNTNTVARPIVRGSSPPQLPDRRTHSTFNKHESTSSRQTNVSPADPEKRYTAMSVTYQGHEVVELISDSEGEL